MLRPPALVVTALLAAATGCGGPDATLPDGRDATPPDGRDAPDAAVADDAAPTVSVTVVTLNLRCLVDDWDARLPLIVDGLVAAAADVIALQEVCAQPGRDALEELAAALAARDGDDLAAARTVTHRAWDTYDEGLAILSRLPIAAVRVTPLPGGALPRKLLAARLDTTAGPLVLAATHLDHQSDSARATQTSTALAALDDLAAGAPALLLGDLNEAPGGGVAAALASAGFSDVWIALHPDDPGATFPATAPRVRIDYVWTRGPVPVAATRILVPPADATAASDHLGVRATVRLR